LFRNVILWAHAAAGGIWIAACACFVIAGLAIEDGSEEQLSFVRRGIVRINRLALVMAAILLLSGAANIANAGMMRGWHLHAGFLLVLAAKIAIFIVMAAALAVTARAAARTRAIAESGNHGAVSGAIRPMVRAHFAMLVLGSVALVLGLWLVGS
jgi:hypothetical protein